MKQRSFLLLLILTICLGFHSFVEASKSRPFSSQQEAQRYLNQHYNKGCHYYNKQNWRFAMDEFEKVVYFFPNSTEAAEAYYYLGVCYFERKEYDFANNAFSIYLTSVEQPAFFEDAVHYKFCIAEHFRCGKRRRPLTFRYFPKWMSGQTIALAIYDEIIVAMPNSDMTVNALYSKAQLLQKMESFREAIETYQILIRRFPKHEMTPLCYLKIAESYSQQSIYEFQNPDILALAELNSRKFKEEFPREEKTELAERYVQRIKDMYAKGLCDMGLFYERMGHPDAAAIYFRSSIEEFPDTYVAGYCRSRLKSFGCEYEEEQPILIESGKIENSCQEKKPCENESLPMQEENPEAQTFFENAYSPETQSQILSLQLSSDKVNQEHLVEEVLINHSSVDTAEVLPKNCYQEEIVNARPYESQLNDFIFYDLQSDAVLPDHESVNGKTNEQMDSQLDVQEKIGTTPYILHYSLTKKTPQQRMQRP
ncbi:tetratricopeptide repeat protein [Candidatus Protochlamydia sp. W-9]|uniref:tetratricopeptide repeat protein n=1 Tax=Candidatus Protochlamydia sp. W-9 TaxID=1785087 RepID=UPI00096A7DF0|nr:tetratricopeptide repeat protein [Candidatus Protochlamydia sp. W-9]